MKHKEILNKTLLNQEINTKEALYLLEQVNLDDLIAGSLKIKKNFELHTFEFCSIINAKSGNCSEDCKFCAQSSFYDTDVKIYDLLAYETIYAQAKNNQDHGIEYFSLVTTGKGIINEATFNQICNIIKKLKATLDIKICASLGILSKNQLKQLKAIGLDRYHHNLETSKDFYKEICSTHTYEERVKTLHSAQAVGLDVCSGGLIGIGEKNADFLSLAFLLKKLKIKSIPINILSPVANTPMENMEILKPKTITKRLAVLRYIFPKAVIRLAAGRIHLKEFETICMNNIVNASITGDLLTTTGSNIKRDFKIIKNLGYK